MMNRKRLIDALGLTGLGLIGCGTWWLSPPWCLVTIGSLLLLLAIAGAMTGGKPHVDDAV